MRNLTDISKVAGRVMSDNSPAILTSVATAGVITTAVLAVKATPHAVVLIQEEEPETKLEIVKLTYRGYIPSAAVGLATIACIVGANSVSSRRNAALMSMYTLTDKAFHEYRAKVEETIGEKKEQEVRDHIAKDRVDANPVRSKEVIITTGGEVLCFDTLTGRYFKSSPEIIRQAQNTINATTINEMYASQNDFYRLIGLPVTGYGEEAGWRTDNQMDIEFSSVLSTDGQPCLAIDYRMAPIRGYYKINGR